VFYADSMFDFQIEMKVMAYKPLIDRTTNAVIAGRSPAGGMPNGLALQRLVERQEAGVPVEGWVDVQEDALEVRIRAEGLASLVGELRQEGERKAA
jgi:hypothetical protein